MSYTYIVKNNTATKYDKNKDIFKYPLITENKLYHEGIVLCSSEFLDISKDELLVYLEIISVCEKNEDMIKLKEKYTEFFLDLNNVKIDVTNQIEKNNCLFTFTSDGERILVKKCDYFKLIKKLSVFNKGDFFITNDKHLTHFFEEFLQKNIKNIKLIKIDNFLYSKDHKFKNKIKDLINKFQLPLKYSSRKKEVKDILELKSINIPIVNFVKHSVDDIISEIKKPGDSNFFITDKYKQIENIEKRKLPTYKLHREDKFKLFDIMKNKDNLLINDTQLDNILRNDEILFSSYKELKVDLEKFYSKNKQDYHVKIFKTLKDSFCFLIQLNDKKIRSFIIQENNEFLVYYNEILEIESSKDFCKEFLANKLKEKNKYKDIDNFTLEEMIITYLFDRLPSDIDNKEFKLVDGYGEPYSIEDINKLNNYIINNCNDNYEILLDNCCSLNRKDKNINIIVDIELKFYTNNIISICIILDKKNYCIADNFYIVEKELDKFNYYMNLMWKKGYFLNDYGYNYYLNFGSIPEDTVITPWWFKSNNIYEFRELLKFISQ